MDQKKYIEVSGNAYESGFQQGTAFSSTFYSLFQSFKKIDFLPFRLQRKLSAGIYCVGLWFLGRIYSCWHKKILNEKPHFKNRWLGLAQGFNVNKFTMYGLTCLEVITSKVPHLPVMGCTSLALDASRTTSQEPLIAYNHDFPDAFSSHLLVRKNSPDFGFPSLCLTYSVLLGAIAGINSEGLAVSVNHAFERRIKKRQAVTLVTYLLQECLDQCATTEQAVSLILKTPVTNGSILTVLDKTGNLAVIEVSSRGNFLRTNQKNYSITFNKFHVKDLEKNELSLQTRGAGMLKGRLVHEPSLERKKRFDCIFDDAKRYSENDIIKILSDHNEGEGGINTICRHHPESGSTIASAILYPKSCRMKVVFGQACAGGYEEYNLL